MKTGPDKTKVVTINPNYRKFPKYSDTQKNCCNHSKIWTMLLYSRIMSPNDADGMANSVEPDQTAPLGAVWSGSALFAQAYLSENLGSLRYIQGEINDKRSEARSSGELGDQLSLMKDPSPRFFPGLPSNINYFYTSCLLLNFRWCGPLYRACESLTLTAELEKRIRALQI